jgi:hypothetical protein
MLSDKMSEYWDAIHSSSIVMSADRSLHLLKITCRNNYYPTILCFDTNYDLDEVVEAIARIRKTI